MALGAILLLTCASTLVVLAALGAPAWIIWPVGLFGPATLFTVLAMISASLGHATLWVLARRMPGVEPAFSRRRFRLLLTSFTASPSVRFTATVLARDASARTDVEVLEALALAQALESS